MMFNVAILWIPFHELEPAYLCAFSAMFQTPPVRKKSTVAIEVKARHVMPVITKTSRSSSIGM